MRKIFYKKWVKICAFILCVISFQTACGSFLAMVLGESYGIYGNTEEEFREKAYDKICRNYSVEALEAYQEDFLMSKLKDTNFRYGIIQADSLKGLDLNDKKIYEACNFDRKVTEDMLFIHSYSIGPSISFYSGHSLLDNFYIHNTGEYCQEKKSMIQNCYYVRDADKFYCQADDKFYPVQFYDEAGYEAEYGDAIESVLNEDGTAAYVWADGQQEIQTEGQRWFLSDIPILMMKDLAELGTIVSEDGEEPNYEDFNIQDGYVVTYTDERTDTRPYYVLSYAAEPLDAKEGFFDTNIFGRIELWERQDYFVQAEALIQIAFAVRYGLFGIFIVSLLVFLGTFAGLMTGAGHHNSKEVVLGWMDKIPFDLFLIGVSSIELCLIAILLEVLPQMSLLLLIQFGIFIVCIGEILGLLFCMSTAVQFKRGIWWKNTVCYRIWNKCYRIITGGLRKFDHVIPMLWKAWVIMAVLAFCEFVGVVATSYHPGTQVFLWFLEKAALYALFSVVLVQMRKLQKAGEMLASGDLKSRIDTNGMFSDFKKHAENLNNIQDGIQRVVEKQLKSEHFKTELITNVSHDIKTPLTSIINYVDLLEKEKIENENALEYIEVLGRQSKRLKKLIEDLMEASKASTGNLAVVFERCDAHVMLTQTIGEFEEKLKANQIELIVQGSSEPFLIQADPRHLWRIFDNLMNNICKYAQLSTRAYVNIEKPDQKGRIIFRNISKYALNIDSEELTERFVRGDSSRNTEGSGLGLSIAKSLTELMNGTFELVIDGDLFKVILVFPISEDPEKEL